MQKIHITLQEHQNLFFTSDLHFGHRNMIRFCNRPWADEKEMTKGLIDNWNNVVSSDDIVFILGDTFWFNDSHAIKKVLSQLNAAEIYIIPGNHDDFDKYYRIDDPRINLCSDIVVLWLESEDNRFSRKITEIWLSHYPMMTWPHRENGAIQLFGHIHSQKGKTEGVDQNLPLHWNQLDIGCDRWNWKPISINQIFDIIK